MEKFTEYVKKHKWVLWVFLAVVTVALVITIVCIYLNKKELDKPMNEDRKAYLRELLSDESTTLDDINFDEFYLSENFSDEVNEQIENLKMYSELCFDGAYPAEVLFEYVDYNIIFNVGPIEDAEDVKYYYDELSFDALNIPSTVWTVVDDAGSRLQIYEVDGEACMDVFLKGFQSDIKEITQNHDVTEPDVIESELHRKNPTAYDWLLDTIKKASYYDRIYAYTEGGDYITFIRGYYEDAFLRYLDSNLKSPIKDLQIIDYLEKRYAISPYFEGCYRDTILKIRGQRNLLGGLNE